MAAIALNVRHAVFSPQSLSLKQLLPALPLAFGLTRSIGLSLQSLVDLLPPFLLAVPKSKTSHSRKAMRSANKGLKDKHNIVNCPACGSPKLAHHLCSSCYNFLSRRWKKESRDNTPDLS
ncbi:hypothetical protein BDN72DRAFT_24556 [Pluteus cervinus]|uniref:Uncharacterized protein n=1 Tax=Pluteus cervinus TaxID=181527 RepID=A0ACD3BGV2_9AGAR|nr:hypothetical protein BDN72DRAFT_24556 [Pluteus cervinus]